MLLLLVIGMSALVETLGASPAIESQPSPQVLRYDLDTANMPNSYKYHYDASDGSSRTEHGAMVDTGKGEIALDVLGAVRWYDEKGHLYEMTYKAGRRAFSAQGTKEPVEILSEKIFVNEKGYNFEFKTSDGVSRKEEGQLITVGDQQGIGVRGSYSYLAPDGQQYIVSYTADDKGYKPTIRIASDDGQ
ncbi:uncharacterized protein [Maniola hyperantus]|uniref:uncharacterized protein n=1 Tax=Aphantopus hyperantus TaxID=2795564 RepID=UPI0037492788